MSDVALFVVDPAESAVLVEARSNVGPISFASVRVDGRAELELDDVDIDAAAVLCAEMHIPISSLESGNSLYDAELSSRLEHRRYPIITVQMRAARALGGGEFSAEADVTIHGTTRRLAGTLSVTMPDENTLVALGRHVVDIRDFAITLPAMLMLKIYPDVSVQFRVTATRV
ncbi:MAG TPA: YceI family protein [Sporichthya sp.]|jgi:polyisoprenoid-binding protein YceI|nr:YceI family protein [Sporichthya sp.]